MLRHREVYREVLASAPVDDLDREVLRRAGLGADQVALLASLSELGHRPAVEVRQQMESALAASRVALRLAHLGWAPFGLFPARDYAVAGRVYDEGGSAAADEFVADAWEESGMLPGVLVRVRILGAGIDEAIHTVSEHRAELVDIAWRAHVDGLFAASIPLVLAQVEGICFDASGKAFFSKHPARRAEVTDEVTLAGLDAALGVTRDALSEDVRPSAATGRLARHGIAHGREVAYGTRVNSWKCWVLLLAVSEWAHQRLRERDEQRVATAEQRWAGSNDADSEGRRRDRRGFMEARLALRNLAIAQMGFHRTFGRFGTKSELNERLPGLGDWSAVHLVEVGGSRWWAWCRAASGWAFAIGADTTSEPWRFWDGAEPPPAGPTGAGWSTVEPPNWRSDTVPGSGDSLPE